jgi:hypothetical protein
VARISIRFFVDDAELDRIDADLPAEPPEIVAACREWVDEWVTMSQPMSKEEVASFEEAFARQFGVRPRQSLEDRVRAEQALADRMIEDRRRAQEALKEREG